MSEGFYPEHLEHIIQSTAARVARMHRHLVMPDDLAQEIRMWMLKHPARTAHWLDKDNLEEPLATFRKIAYRRCQDYVAKERAARTGGKPSDHVLYPLAAIEAALPMVWDLADRPQAEHSETSEIRSNRDPAHGMDWLAVAADMTAAYDRLDADDRQLLGMRYDVEMRLIDIARHLEVSEATVHRRITRALLRMAECLGGEQP